MEREILALFAERYPASAQRRGGKPLRLRRWRQLLPDAFSSAASRLSFLEAAERLERSGILRLLWEKRRVGDELAAAELIDPRALYLRLGRPSPDDEAALLAARARELSGTALFAFIADKADTLPGVLSPRDLDDAAAFFAFDRTEAARLPIRALSVRLYRDSKRLESLLRRLKPISALAVREGVIRSPAFPRRSYPEASIAGAVELEFEDGSSWSLAPGPVSLSAAAAQRLRKVRAAGASAGDGPLRALSVENKETFYAFAADPLGFDAVVYCGGRPNRAVKALLRALAGSGAAMFHSGDLDADGIAILAEVAAHCGARPFGMDAAVFDRYLPYARALGPSLVARLGSLDDAARALPGIEELIVRIRETARGVEQEVIDYAELIRESERRR